MSINKQKLLNAISESSSLTEAAEAAGVSRKTVYNLLKDHDFCRELEDLQNRLAIETFEGLKERRELALATISNIMNDEEVAASVRLSAATEILNQSDRALQRAMTATGSAKIKSDPLNMDF